MTLHFREMMQVISVSLPPDAVKSEVAEIEISSDASVYYLKDLTLMSNGRRLVDRASVAEIPELLHEPMVVVVATKKAANVTMTNDADPSFKWDVTMGLDCPIKVMTEKHKVHQARGNIRLAVTSETTPRMLKSRSNNIKLMLTP